MLEQIKGMTERRKVLIAKMGIFDEYGLLCTKPRKYIDMDNIQPLSSFKEGELAICKVKIYETPKVRYINKAMNITEIKVTDGAYTMECYWFNQPFVAKKDITKEYFIIGKVSVFNGKRRFSNPTLEPVEGAMTGIVPIYSLVKGMRQKEFRNLIKNTLDYIKQSNTIYNLPDTEMDILSAFYQLHFPDDENTLSQAIDRLKYDEAVYLACAFDLIDIKTHTRAVRGDLYSISEFEALLPFNLTCGQKSAVSEIARDMDKDTPMNRLLQGNVGCGKTVVAVFALYANMKNGYQSAFMSPTEVLAIQNYNTVKKYLPDCNIALILGSTPKKEKEAILHGVLQGEVDILVGTHSLIQDSVEFKSLNLVITDEQHRFGVKQRAKLSAMGGHTLIMSATPIPRTLALIAFDKLDLTVISEMPRGRVPVSTHIIFPNKKQDMYKFIFGSCKQGRQAYVVCPLIDKSEAIDARSVKEIFKELSTQYLKGLKIGLLHGRMKSQEKDEILTGFREGKIDVLVSTTVIEVGVDVRNATIMVIENSDRFGLAALHQLRGRVGRGNEKSYCFACVDSVATLERLTVFKGSNDGLEIARMDLSQRGMGELVGISQHGGDLLKFIDLTRDGDILKKAKGTVRNANKDCYNAIKKQTLMFYGNILEDIILN